MARETPEWRVEELARVQHGVISRAQAVELGMHPRVMAHRVAIGRWRLIHPGVYRPAGVPASWRSDLMAAVLWAEPGALASHRAAGRLWGLEGLEDAPVEIVARFGRGRSGVIVHRLRLDDRPARRMVDGLPVTAPERTLLDLAGVATASRVGVALDDALRRGLTTLTRLWRVLERDGGSGRKGTAALRRSLELRGQTDERMESLLEARLFRLLRRAGLPPPIPQYEVRSAGRLVARLDFAYPEIRLGIETHGYRWHGGYERWRRDIRRENLLKRMGWIVPVFTWDDVRSEPAHVVAEVRSALIGRPEVLPEMTLSTSKMGEPAGGAGT